MKNLMDKAYYRLKELFTPGSYDLAYQEGYETGKKVMKAAILAELRQNDLYQWSDKTLKLGYEVAMGRIEKVKR